MELSERCVAYSMTPSFTQLGKGLALGTNGRFFRPFCPWPSSEESLSSESLTERRFMPFACNRSRSKIRLSVRGHRIEVIDVLSTAWVRALNWSSVLLLMKNASSSSTASGDMHGEFGSSEDTFRGTAGLGLGLGLGFTAAVMLSDQKIPIEGNRRWRREGR